MPPRRYAPLLSCFVTAAAPAWLSAQTGVAPSVGATEASFEARLLTIPDTASARLMTRTLSASPHMAGTPAQAATRDYVIAQLRSWGLETWTKEYLVYLPQPEVVSAWLTTGPGSTAVRLNLDEPAVRGDRTSAGPQVPPFNAYGHDGDVTAPVVYINTGLGSDYRTLDSLGVSVRGSIVVARYGRSFRGIKAREAENHGAVGLILYSDPLDDGYVRGEVYPRGPMRPPGGIQRGTVMNASGDPTTPGAPSTAGAVRLPEDSLPVPRIPVIPMGYGNARRFLAKLAGPAAPEGWQGGLPFQYRVGPGPARLRLKVRSERGAGALHPIWNTFGIIRGTTYPDEWVVVGAHRDAWSPGAGDNVSGTVTVLETARAFAALARAALRPARTVVFVTWDAEEWGLMGSTEWVEELEDSVNAHVVAYINEDDVASGTRFAAAASPSLKPLIRDLTHYVPEPGGHGTVYDAWLREGLSDTSALRLDNLGGGSDFAAFTHHLGIPSASVSFGSLNGVYHSMYDSYAWMTRFGDRGYRAHRAVAQLVSLAVARLANAPILPLDCAALGGELAGYVTDLDSNLAARHWSVPTAALLTALTRLAAAGQAFAAARDSALADDLPAVRAAQVNRWLMQVERRLTRPQGLVSRPWNRSLEFASDVDNGYSTMAFPSVNEAIRFADPSTAERELADLVNHVDQAREAIEQATAALR